MNLIKEIDALKSFNRVSLKEIKSAHEARLKSQSLRINQEIKLLQGNAHEKIKVQMKEMILKGIDENVKKKLELKNKNLMTVKLTLERDLLKNRIEKRVFEEKIEERIHKIVLKRREFRLLQDPLLEFNK